MTAPLRVLIVDDTPDIRMLLKVALSSMEGLETIGEAGDGEEAVRLAAELQPDAVLLDLAMPVMDGLQATPEIRRLAPDTRVIILSGFSKDRLGPEALAVGADAYIEKGTNPRSIADTIREVCSTPRPDAGGSGPQPPEHAPAADATAGEEASGGLESWRRRIAFAVEQVGELAGAFASFGRTVRSRVAFDRAGLAFSGPDGYRLAAVCGTDDGSMPLGTLVAVTDGFADTLHRGSTVTVADTTEQDGPLNHLHAVNGGIRSYAAVPVRAGGSAQALVSFASRRPHAFPQGDLDYLESAVREAAAAFYILWSLGHGDSAVPAQATSEQAMREWNRIVRHDLRSPLTVISGFTETMRSAWTELPDTTKLEFVDAIARGANAMTTLLSDMEDVDRIESGVGSVEPKPIKLCALISEVTKDLKVGRGRAIDVTIEPGLPMALADENDQRRVLANLLENAFKFSDDGDAVGVDVSTEGDMIVVSVTDQGMGIPPEDQEEVFQKFTRAKQRSNGSVVPGSGLGLYICRSIVEAHGGRIWLESELGSGTTVRYTIPAATAAAA